MGVLQDRIDRLDEGDRRLLQAGSVEGDAFAARVVAVLAAEDELTVEERLDRLQRVHRLIVPLGEIEFPEARPRRASASCTRSTRTRSTRPSPASAARSGTASAAEELQRLHAGPPGRGGGAARGPPREGARVRAGARLPPARGAGGGAREPASGPAAPAARARPGRAAPDAERGAVRADVLVRLARLDVETAEIVGDVSLYGARRGGGDGGAGAASRRRGRPHRAGARRAGARPERARALGAAARGGDGARHAPAYDGLAYLFKNTGLWLRGAAAPARAGALDPRTRTRSGSSRSSSTRTASTTRARRPRRCSRGARTTRTTSTGAASSRSTRATRRPRASGSAAGTSAIQRTRSRRVSSRSGRRCHGDRSRARALLATAEPGAPADGTFTYWIAKIYTALGEPEAAVLWLGRAEDARVLERALDREGPDARRAARFRAVRPAPREHPRAVRGIPRAGEQVRRRSPSLLQGPPR